MDVRTAIEELDAMRAGDDEATCHMLADAILLSALEDNGPVDEKLAAAWRRAQSRVGFLYE